MITVGEFGELFEYVEGDKGEKIVLRCSDAVIVEFWVWQVGVNSPVQQLLVVYFASKYILPPFLRTYVIVSL